MTNTERSSGPTSAGRAGYVVAIVVNAVLLWVAHQLLDWEWPRFLTTDYERLLPWVRLSFASSIGANIVYWFNDGPRIKAASAIVSAATGVALSARTYQIFPFDFTGYDYDWSWLIRLIVVIAILGGVVGVVANVIRLLIRLGA